jgi:regulatory protein
MNRPQSATGRRPRKRPKPLDAARLEEMALAYVARFATSAGRLRAYCQRKLRERGFEGADEGAAPPDVEALVERFVATGYVDDAGFARVKSGSLLRRGYGARRIREALRSDGIDEPLRCEVAPREADRREATAAYARRRRLGPFAREGGQEVDRAGHQKQLAALLRAGHDADHARRVLSARTEVEVEDWVAEARVEEDRDQ